MIHAGKTLSNLLGVLCLSVGTAVDLWLKILLHKIINSDLSCLCHQAFILSWCSLKKHASVESSLVMRWNKSYVHRYNTNAALLWRWRSFDGLLSFGLLFTEKKTWQIDWNRKRQERWIWEHWCNCERSFVIITHSGERIIVACWINYRQKIT